MQGLYATVVRADAGQIIIIGIIIGDKAKLLWESDILIFKAFQSNGFWKAFFVSGECRVDITA